MREYPEHRRAKGEPIDEPQEHLSPNDGIYKPRQELLRKDGMLLNQLGQVIEAGRDRHCKEAETDDRAGVADERENPHLGQARGVSSFLEALKNGRCSLREGLSDQDACCVVVVLALGALGSLKWTRELFVPS